MSTWQVIGERDAIERAGPRPAAVGRGHGATVDRSGVRLLLAGVIGLVLTLAVGGPAWITTAGLIATCVVIAVGWERAITGTGRSRAETMRRPPDD